MMTTVRRGAVVVLLTLSIACGRDGPAAPSGYRGAYKGTHGITAFEWESSRAVAEWSATGTFRRDSMAVEYNRVMLLTDFEDAV